MMAWVLFRVLSDYFESVDAGDIEE